MRVAVPVEEKVAQDGVDQNWISRGRHLLESPQGNLEFIRNFESTLVHARRLGGRADEEAGENVGKTGMVLEEAQKAKVWMVSPTTMMAVLTTALAVLKDAATRKQVHIIQKHLIMLSKDFERFQKRMDDLAKHISQAHQDIEQVSRIAERVKRAVGEAR